jgi:hypothetical protein
VPLQKLQFRPGVNREGTTLSNEGGWYDCDKVRFRSGYPEKLGGWTAASYNTFLGVCRSLWNWITLKGANLLGVGTNLKFYIESGGDYYDITPIKNTTTGTATFAATTGSNILTVTDGAAAGLSEDSFVTFSGAVSLGGNITAAVLNKEYQIVSVISSSVYTIAATVNANASDVGNGGASVVAAYQINSGSAFSVSGVGFGTSPFGGFSSSVSASALNGSIDNVVTTITVNSTAAFTTTGTLLIDNELITYSGKTATDFTGCVRGVSGTTAASHTSGTLAYQAGSFTGWGIASSSGVLLPLYLWSQTNFGEDLLFSPRGGALYLWQPGSAPTPAFSTRGTLVSGTDVPSRINEIMVSDSTRITIAFGCTDYGAYDPDAAIDPMLIRWTAQESYTDWTPTATNQAGSYRLSHGSAIITALQTRQEINVWTDAAIYSMQYLGPPLVWGFTLLADNISIASPNAMATASGVVYWMGVDKFYVYSGRVETLPCSVRTYIYSDINREQFFQIYAGTNEGYSEVWWFYCSANSNTIDRYVIFNYLDRVWYYGSLDRTAWLDSPLRSYPMAATGNNLLVYHEAAVDDGSTNPPSPINAYVQSSDFDINDGHNYGFVWRMLPDITFDGSNTSGLTQETPFVTFTMRPRQNPGSGYSTSYNDTVSSTQSYAGQQTYNVQQFTEIVYTRARGRQMAFRISSNTLGTQWQLGVPRIDVRPDGRK